MFARGLGVVGAGGGSLYNPGIYFSIRVDFFTLCLQVGSAGNGTTPSSAADELVLGLALLAQDSQREEILLFRLNSTIHFEGLVTEQ